MSTDTPIQVTVELDSVVDPIQGTLTEFSGTLGLLKASERTLDASPECTDPQAEDR